jgi:hypothetical protein
MLDDDEVVVVALGVVAAGQPGWLTVRVGRRRPLEDSSRPGWAAALVEASRQPSTSRFCTDRPRHGRWPRCRRGHPATLMAAHGLPVARWRRDAAEPVARSSSTQALVPGRTRPRPRRLAHVQVTGCDAPPLRSRRRSRRTVRCGRVHQPLARAHAVAPRGRGVTRSRLDEATRRFSGRDVAEPVEATTWTLLRMRVGSLD